MRPETIARRQSTRKKEQHARHAIAVVRLAETVARHEKNGDLVQAAVFAELLIEAQERLAADPVDPHVGTFHRDVFAARTRDELQRETHVIVGDHSPEKRREDLEWAADAMRQGR